MSGRGLLELLLDRHVSTPVVVTRRGLIAAQNEAAEKLLGGEVGTPVEVLFDAASHPKLARAIRVAPASCELQARRGGAEPVAVRLDVLSSGADEYVLMVSRIGAEYSEPMARRLLDANDRLTNLTRELSRQSAELEAARARFEALADLREHFVSMLAHDVRGALHGIALNTEIIERTDEPTSEVRRTALQRIRRAAARITDLVDKVLESARTQAGHIVLDARPTSVSSVAQEVIETYVSIAEAAGIRVELVDRLGDAIVSGDRALLGQVLGNLVENAIRHSLAGTAITLELSATPQTVRIAVRDQGRGIPVELQDRVFDRFVRAPGIGGSLGLGLYVARELVTLHGGRIYVADSGPNGSCFVVELPRAS